MTTKPYAWAIQGCSRMWTGEFAELDAKAEAARCGGTCEAFPLYTTQQLTDAQIDEIMQPLTQNTQYSWRKFARSIESAHGIGGAP